MGCLALAAIVGAALLWPARQEARPAPETGFSVGAEVTEVTTEGCERVGEAGCEIVRFILRGGRQEGSESFLVLPPSNVGPRITPGDRIRVQRNPSAGFQSNPADPFRPGTPARQPYAFVDFERKPALAWYAAGLVVVVLALMRLRGLRALVALAAAGVICTQFMVPAILDGGAPLATALVGAVAILLITMLLSHGLSFLSAAATLGTAASLLFAAVLATIAVKAAHVTGLSSPEAALLQSSPEGALSFQGLVLAGMVIGVLGVLDDVTISQTSTVLALRRANAALGARRLYREALQVGRDHVGATINTLVLAYVGASLPLLLVFNEQGTPFGEAVNREPVAAEILAMLVGSVTIVLAVPLTTLVAAALASRMPVADVAAQVDDHGHAHAHA